ncbi:MAG TPA: RNA polymerase-binding protein DksA [Chloroflexota bacterium]|nr:RNA polymerase-binding protein DksA [Chloroflexota bacterium]
MGDGDSTLTPAEISVFYRRLEAQKHELLGQIADLRGEVAVADDDQETPDDGSVLEGREEALGQIAFVRDELDRVARAMRRIAEGTYGLSEVSGEPIPRGRLEALPTATTLVDELPPRP